MVSRLFHKARHSYRMLSRVKRVVGVVFILSVAGGFVYSWPHIRTVQLEKRILQRTNVYQKKLEEKKLLQIELDSLSSLRRVHYLATHDLNMIRPRPEQLTTIVLP